MASLKYSGNLQRMTVTLASTYTAGSGTMALTAGHGARLPSSGDFWLVTTSGTYRAFKVTARSTDTLTVVGAQDGTADGDMAASTELEWNLTASALAQLISDIRYGSGVITPPPISGWSTNNASDATIAYPNDLPTIRKPQSTNDDWTRLERGLTVPYTLTALMDYELFNTQYASCGVAISANGNLMITFGLVNYAGVPRLAVAYRNGTSYSGEPSGAKYDNGNNPRWSSMPLWLRIVNNGTNRIYYTSGDGIDWYQFATDSAGTHVTETYGGICAIANGNGSASVYRHALVRLRSWLVG